MFRLEENNIVCDKFNEQTYTVPIKEIEKILVGADCSSNPSKLDNENTQSSVKAGSPRDGKESTSQAESAGIRDDQIYLQTSRDMNMCPPKELPVPVYIPTHPSKSGDSKNTDDDCSAVSSLDSFDNEEFPISSTSHSRAQRPIFAKYWNASDDYGTKTERESEKDCPLDATKACRSASFTLSRCAREATMPLPDEFAYQEFNRDFARYNTKCGNDAYEDMLRINELGRTTIPSATSLKEVEPNESVDQSTDSMSQGNQSNHFISASPSQRSTNARTLFSNKYSQSTPSLSSYGYREFNSVRKTSSTSSLRKKQRSCLRSRSCSVDSTALESSQSLSSKLSVSFDSRVCVHEYEKPHERYAVSGWSRWFV